MSNESFQWLNRNVLVGYTEKRGTAWHYRAEDQGTEPNHYPNAIPVEDVQRRLFDWEPEERPVYLFPTEDAPMVAIDGKKAVVPSDNPSHVFGIFSEGYQAHGYDDWLIGNVSHILDADLQISSAGLLKQRAVAWVEISMPDTITTSEGIEFRPNLLATTSLDGTVATTYKRTCTMVVCDNTWGMAMGEDSPAFKVKHSKYSALRKLDAAEALDIVHGMADDLEREFAALCDISVTDDQFRKIVEQAVPITDDTKPTGVTVAERKRGELHKLWTSDPRVQPWTGSGFGVVQAFNTHAHHLRPTRGETVLAERNMLGAINGTFEKEDAATMSIMRKVLATS